MQVSDFDYTLPSHLIAQSPSEKRDESRLLVVPPRTGPFGHRHFYDSPDYFKAGDILVLNDTKVFKARLLLQRQSGANVEVFLIAPVASMPGCWSCLMKPAKRVKEGEALFLGNQLVVTVRQKQWDDGLHIVEFNSEAYSDGQFNWSVLDRWAHIPLPPYIAQNESLADRYQTVYAEAQGSVAAPTAGLHFTPELLALLRERGVTVVSLTLHVGLGTFKPIETASILDHKMHSETVIISSDTAALLTEARSKNRPIIAVGTTVTRALESAFENGICRSGSFETDIFIYPGYTFKAVSGLITNFHLPRSTLLCLVSALIGRDRLMAAYHEAIAQAYRFYSFGDAMLILPDR